MKRLSKVQKEIEELVGQVPPISAEQYAWARANVNYFIAVAQGIMDIKCPNCHTSFNKRETTSTQSRWAKEDTTYTCPHCGAQVQVRTIADSMRGERQKNIVTNRKQEDFFQVMNVIGDWQVTRLIYMRRYVYVRKPSTDWEFFEVCQAWNNPKYDKTYFRAYQKCMMSSYQFNPYSLLDWRLEQDENGHYRKDENGDYISYAIPRELIPRKPNGSNYFETTAIAPNEQILPYYQRRGLGRKAFKAIGYNAMMLFQSFAEDRGADMETLLKAGEFELFKHICGEGYAKDFFTAWKICQRNHYKPSNKKEWIDLVDMLIKLHFDIHNAHYVCPADLSRYHAELCERIRRNREREWARQSAERELARRKEEEQAEEKFKERIAKYLDMEIHNDNLTIIVLPSIDAFKAEGDSLGHCVYSCGYYKRENSLILSARDSKTGKRWETIEVGLKDLTILQCYGYGDEFTEKHNEIRELMTDNMWQIKERRDGARVRIAS